MSELNSRFHTDNLLEPLGLLHDIAIKMTAIWPSMHIDIMTLKDQDHWPASINESQFAGLIENPDSKVAALNEYFDILLGCAREQKPYFQPLLAGEHQHLAAVVPVYTYTCQTGGQRPKAFQEPGVGAPRSVRRTHLLCFWRLAERSAGAVLYEREKRLIEMIATQFNLYGTLHNTLISCCRLFEKFRHDLRSPLTSVTMISGLLQQAEGGVETAGQDAWREMGEMLQTASKKMDALLDGFKVALASS